MSSQFPSSLDSFVKKVDNVDIIKAVDINNLQDGIVRIENTLKELISDYQELLTLCHFEGDTEGYRNLSANASGAIRYQPGKYGSGVFIEHGITNYVGNPAFRTSTDNWIFETVTGNLSSMRISSDYIPGINSNYCLQISVSSTGDVEGKLKTTLTGLSANTAYAISFWVKDNGTSTHFNGSGVRIATSDGSGAAGPSFTVTSSWQRITAVYTTSVGQDSFVLEVRFAKTGATTSDQLFFGGFQIETGSVSSSYADGDQGTGYIWTGDSNASSSIRSNTVLQYPVNTTSQVYLEPHQGTIGFWLSPVWNNSDSMLRYLFDTSLVATKKRISIFKDTLNKLNFGIYEPDNANKILTTNQAVSWEPANGWMHIACTYSFDDVNDTWTLQAYVNGALVDTTTTGTATTSSSLGSAFFLGTTYSATNYADARFDEFFTRNDAISSTIALNIFKASSSMSEGILNVALGSDITDATIGVSKQISHGLNIVPSFIEITEKGPGIVYLSDTDAITSDYFYVKSTASSINFQWRAWR